MPSDATDFSRYRRTWEQMDRRDRRRVLRAVNRARPLEDPAEAALAVVFAQRQRRLWRRWWWVIPLAGALIALPLGVEAALTNLALGAAFVGVLAALFTWRAGKALAANQAVVDAARQRRRSGSPGARKAPRKGKGSRKQRKRGGGR